MPVGGVCFEGKIPLREDAVSQTEAAAWGGSVVKTVVRRAGVGLGEECVIAEVEGADITARDFCCRGEGVDDEADAGCEQAPHSLMLALDMLNDGGCGVRGVQCAYCRHGLRVRTRCSPCSPDADGLNL